MEHIIHTIKNSITSLEVAKEYFEKNNYRTFWPKTMEKIQAELNIPCYYSKNKVAVLNKFSISYNEIQKDWHTRREWLEFNVYNSSELLDEIIKTIEYKKQSLVKAEKTLQDKDKIKITLEKIIELSKQCSYENYNSEMVKIIAHNLKDSFYLPSNLK